MDSLHLLRQLPTMTEERSSISGQLTLGTKEDAHARLGSSKQREIRHTSLDLCSSCRLDCIDSFASIISNSVRRAWVVVQAFWKVSFAASAINIVAKAVTDVGNASACIAVQRYTKLSPGAGDGEAKRGQGESRNDAHLGKFYAEVGRDRKGGQYWTWEGAMGKAVYIRPE